MSTFSSNVSAVWSLNLRTDIFETSRDRWLLSFAHLVNRHRLVEMSIAFSIFWRKLTLLAFCMIFCFRSFAFMYVDQSFWSCVADHLRLSRWVSFIASSHSLVQNVLTCRLNIVQNTIFSITDCRNFWISHTYSSISRTDDERDKSDAFFSTSLTFSRSISFQALRETRDEFDSISQSIRVEMRTWFDDWLKSDLVMQCSSLSVKCDVMNVRSMMLAAMRFSHVMNFLDNVSVKSCAFTMFKSSSAIACCVSHDESLQKRWCRLKSLSRTWWFVSASTTNRLIFDSDDELSLDE
jgi:hypothetical protein